MIVGGGALPAVRVDVNPTALNNYGPRRWTTCARSLADRQREPAQGRARRTTDKAWSLATTDQLMKAAEYQPLIVAYQNGAAVRLVRRRRR